MLMNLNACALSSFHFGANIKVALTVRILLTSSFYSDGNGTNTGRSKNAKAFITGFFSDESKTLSGNVAAKEHRRCKR